MNNIKITCIKGLSVFAVVILVTVVFNGMVMRTNGEVIGNPPPQNGDWVITEETNVNNETITLNGNLIITKDGKLTLYNSVLTLNCNSNGQYKIQVNDSGELNILWSSIKNSGNDYNYDFFYLNNSKGVISNSTIMNIGYSEGGSRGLKIESSNVTVFQNTFLKSFNGLYITNATPVIMSNTFKYNTNAGIVWENGDPFWEDQFVNMDKVSDYNNIVRKNNSINLDLDENSPTSSTLGLYHLNNGSGSISIDSSGNWNNGTIIGPGWTTDSKFGNYGLYFYGTDDYIDYGNTFNKPNGTVDLWFKLENNFSSQSSANMYLYETQNVVNYNGLFLNSTSGKLTFEIMNSTLYQINSDNNFWLKDMWYHIAASWGSDGMMLYVNNNLQLETNAFTGYIGNGGNAIMGLHIGEESLIYDFIGYMDEIQFSDEQITDFNTTFCTSGYLISEQLKLDSDIITKMLTISEYEPSAQNKVQITILNADNNQPISHLSNLDGPRVDLSSINGVDYPRIKIKFIFSGNGTASPILYGWNLTGTTIVTDNYFINNKYGMELLNVSPIIKGNYFWNNTDSGIKGNNSNSIIENNQIYANEKSGKGLLFENSSPYIFNNQISNCSIGIHSISPKSGYYLLNQTTPIEKNPDRYLSLPFDNTFQNPSESTTIINVSNPKYTTISNITMTLDPYPYYYKGWEGLDQNIKQDETSNPVRNSVVTIKNGILYAVWEDDRADGPDEEGTGPGIYFNKRIGDSWYYQDDLKLSDDTYQNALQAFPDIAVENDNIFVVWDEDRDPIDGVYDIAMRKSSNLGVNWDPVSLINSDPNIISSRLPSVSANNNFVYVVWEGKDVLNNWDIYINKGTYGSWIYTDTLVNTNTAGTQGRPDISALNGTVSVCWEDDRNSNWDIYGRISNDNASTWTDPSETKINKITNSSNQNAPSVSVGYNNTILIVWEDDRYSKKRIHSNFYDGSVWENTDTVAFNNTNSGDQVAPDSSSNFENDDYFLVFAEFNQQTEIYFINYSNGLWESNRYNVAYDYNGNWNQTEPSISFENGIICFSWSDQRNSIEIYTNSYSSNWEKMPLNVKMYIGNKTNPSWAYSGRLSTSQNISNFVQDLNSYLSRYDNEIDEYVTVPIKFKTDTGGGIEMKNIRILYYQEPPSIIKNEIEESTTGIELNYGNPKLYLNTFNSNDIALKFFNSNYTFQGETASPPSEDEYAFQNNFIENDIAVKLTNSTATLLNCTFLNNSNLDLHISENSELVVINTSYVKHNIIVNDTSNLTYKWFLTLKFTDLNEDPAVDVKVNITNMFKDVKTEYTDSNGLITNILLNEVSVYNNSRLYYTPHRIKTESGNNISLPIDFTKNLELFYGNDSDGDRLDDSIEDSADILWYEAEHHVESPYQVIEANLLSTSNRYHGISLNGNEIINDTFPIINKGKYRTYIRAKQDTASDQFNPEIRITVFDGNDKVIDNETHIITDEYETYSTSLFTIGSDYLKLIIDDDSINAPQVDIDRITFVRVHNLSDDSVYITNPGQITNSIMTDSDFDWVNDNLEVRNETFWFEAEDYKALGTVNIVDDKNASNSKALQCLNEGSPGLFNIQLPTELKSDEKYRFYVRAKKNLQIYDDFTIDQLDSKWVKGGNTSASFWDNGVLNQTLSIPDIQTQRTSVTANGFFDGESVFQVEYNVTQLNADQYALIIHADAKNYSIGNFSDWTIDDPLPSEKTWHKIKAVCGGGIARFYHTDSNGEFILKKVVGINDESITFGLELRVKGDGIGSSDVSVNWDNVLISEKYDNNLRFTLEGEGQNYFDFNMTNSDYEWYFRDYTPTEDKYWLNGSDISTNSIPGVVVDRIMVSSISQIYNNTLFDNSTNKYEKSKTLTFDINNIKNKDYHFRVPKDTIVTNATMKVDGTIRDIELVNEGQLNKGGADIYNDKIVWHEEIEFEQGPPYGTYFNIYSYDLNDDGLYGTSDDKFTRITHGSFGNYLDHKYPSIYEDNIVYQQYDSTNSDWDIYLNYTANSTERSIYTGANDQIYPAIWGRYITWLDDGSNPGTSDDYIYVYDLKEPTNFPTNPIVITESKGALSPPKIYENRIVWASNDNQPDDEIYMAEFSTYAELYGIGNVYYVTQITNDGSNQDNPDIYGTRITYEQNGGIVLYDYRSITTTSVAGSNALHPSIWGDKIVYTKISGGQQKIVLYDITKSKSRDITPLTTQDPTYDPSPVICRDKIAWDEYDDIDTNLVSIHLADSEFLLNISDDNDVDLVLTEFFLDYEHTVNLAGEINAYLLANEDEADIDGFINVPINITSNYAHLGQDAQSNDDHLSFKNINIFFEFLTDPLTYDTDKDGVDDGYEFFGFFGYDLIETEDAVDIKEWRDPRLDIPNAYGEYTIQEINFIYQTGVALTSSNNYTFVDEGISDSWVKLRYDVEETGKYKIKTHKELTGTIIDTLQGIEDGKTYRVELGGLNSNYNISDATYISKVMQNATYFYVESEDGNRIEPESDSVLEYANIEEIEYLTTIEGVETDNVSVMVNYHYEGRYNLTEENEYRIFVGLDMSLIPDKLNPDKKEELGTASEVPDGLKWINISMLRILNFDTIRIEKQMSEGLDTDTDNDFLSDGDEAENYGYPLSSDADKDGLLDISELYHYNTDPEYRDSDYDGIRDGVELGLIETDIVDWNGAPSSPGSWTERICRWGNPFNYSLINNYDADPQNTTDPLDSDTDLDGLPDGWNDGWHYNANPVHITKARTYHNMNNRIKNLNFWRYDEANWKKDGEVDNIVQIYEGEDLNLDGRLESNPSGWGFDNITFEHNRFGETDPLTSDTDSDEIPDGYETWYSTKEPIYDFTSQDSLTYILNPQNGSDKHNDLDTTFDEISPYTTPIGYFHLFEINNSITERAIRLNYPDNIEMTDIAGIGIRVLLDDSRRGLPLARFSLYNGELVSGEYLPKDRIHTKIIHVQDLFTSLYAYYNVQDAIFMNTTYAVDPGDNNRAVIFVSVSWLPDGDDKIEWKGYHNWTGQKSYYRKSDNPTWYDNDLNPAYDEVYLDHSFILYNNTFVGDNLTNLGEFIVGANPKNRDTDGILLGENYNDNLTDGFEVGFTQGDADEDPDAGPLTYPEPLGGVIFRTNIRDGAVRFDHYGNSDDWINYDGDGEGNDINGRNYTYDQTVIDPFIYEKCTLSENTLLFSLEDTTRIYSSRDQSNEELYVWNPGVDFENYYESQEGRFIKGTVHIYTYQGTVNMDSFGPNNVAFRNKELYLSNVFDVDSDDDGIYDGEEADKYKESEESYANPDRLINLRDPDSDNDGLDDGLEKNPNNDTDDDGKINVLDVDSDSDGLWDGEDGPNGWYMLTNDTDNDGIWDGPETDHFVIYDTNPYSDDGNEITSYSKLLQSLGTLMGVDVDSRGNIYFLEERKLKMLSNDYLELLSTAYTENSNKVTTLLGSNSLDGAQDVAVDGSGNIIISDYNSSSSEGRILKLPFSYNTSDPKQDLKVLLEGSFYPQGIDTNSGDIFYFDTKQNVEALKILSSNYSDSNPTFNSQIQQTLLNTTVFDDPCGLAVDGSGQIYMIDNSGSYGKLKLLLTGYEAGNTTLNTNVYYKEIYVQQSNFKHLDVNSNGDIYFNSAGTIYKMNNTYFKEYSNLNDFNVQVIKSVSAIGLCISPSDDLIYSTGGNEIEKLHDSSTHIKNADTDGDGLADGYDQGAMKGELVNNRLLSDRSNLYQYTHTFQLEHDSDNDGLSDYYEVLGWTIRIEEVSDVTGDAGEYTERLVLSDPSYEPDDRDGDNLNDSLEFEYTDPSYNDTDDDGLFDNLEDQGTYGALTEVETNPLDQDTDDDRLADGWIDGWRYTGADGGFISDWTYKDNVTQAWEGEDLDCDGTQDYTPADNIRNDETSPYLKDSDSDGIADGDEIFFQLNYHAYGLYYDLDTAGTREPDDNLDGNDLDTIIDYWDVTGSGVPFIDLDNDKLNNSLDADSDGDGLTDGEENRNGDTIFDIHTSFEYLAGKGGNVSIEVWSKSDNGSVLLKPDGSSTGATLTFEGGELVAEFQHNVTINASEILYIEEGLTLKFAPGRGIIVNGNMNGAGGALYVYGKSNEPVKFTSFNTSSTWLGLHFYQTAESLLDYANITYADTPSTWISGNKNSSVYIKDGTIDIMNTYMNGTKPDTNEITVGIFSHNSFPVVSGCEIRDFEHGIFSLNDVFDNYPYKDMIIVNNDIMYNYYGISYDNCDYIFIQDNNIENNTDYGIGEVTTTDYENITGNHIAYNDGTNITYDDSEDTIVGVNYVDQAWNCNDSAPDPGKNSIIHLILIDNKFFKIAFETNPYDRDTDDDYIFDGHDLHNFDNGNVSEWNCDYDGDGLMNAVDRDSDDDSYYNDWGDRYEDDRDHDGVTEEPTDHDGYFKNDSYETNPLDADTDDDGLIDGMEIFFGTDPNDADCDDDGVLDGAEPYWRIDTDGDGKVNAWDSDSDGDGILDGTEMGITLSEVTEDTNLTLFVPDADNTTTTDPLIGDTDGDGLYDGYNDANNNLNRETNEDVGEDTDCDGKVDYQNGNPVESDPNDIDSDDDGLSDGHSKEGLKPSYHFLWDFDGDSVPNILDTDSDNDNILDGIEEGITLATVTKDTNLTLFVPDADPRFKTDSVDMDSDDDNITDGYEDSDNDGIVESTDYNGALDSGETNASNQYTDRDSIKDGDEDSDNDGIVDSGETDPRIEDTDGDGLWEGTNKTVYGYIGEESVGTNALKFDTDNDELSDGQEVNGWEVTIIWATTNEQVEGPYAVSSDPLDKDTEDDGVTDFFEFQNSSDPNKDDTDGDLILDKYEVTGQLTQIEGDPPKGLTKDKPEINGYLVLETKWWYCIPYFTAKVRVDVYAKDTAGLSGASIQVLGQGSRYVMFPENSKYGKVSGDFKADWGKTFWTGYDIKVNVTDINGNWVEGKGHIKSVVEKIVELLAAAWNAFVKALKALASMMYKWIWGVIEKIANKITQPIKDAYNNWLLNVANVINGEDSISSIDDFTTGLFSVILAGAFYKALKVIKTLIRIVIGIVGVFVKIVGGLANKVMDFLKPLIMKAITNTMMKKKVITGYLTAGSILGIAFNLIPEGSPPWTKSNAFKSVTLSLFITSFISIGIHKIKNDNPGIKSDGLGLLWTLLGIALSTGIGKYLKKPVVGAFAGLVCSIIGLIWTITNDDWIDFMDILILSDIEEIISMISVAIGISKVVNSLKS